VFLDGRIAVARADLPRPCPAVEVTFFDGHQARQKPFFPSYSISSGRGDSTYLYIVHPHIPVTKWFANMRLRCKDEMVNRLKANGRG
jgi:hypothetical protein